MTSKNKKVQKGVKTKLKSSKQSKELLENHVITDESISTKEFTPETQEEVFWYSGDRNQKELKALEDLCAMSDEEASNSFFDREYQRIFREPAPKSQKDSKNVELSTLSPGIQKNMNKSSKEFLLKPKIHAKNIVPRIDTSRSRNFIKENILLNSKKEEKTDKIVKDYVPNNSYRGSKEAKEIVQPSVASTQRYVITTPSKAYLFRQSSMENKQDVWREFNITPTKEKQNNTKAESRNALPVTLGFNNPNYFKHRRPKSLGKQRAKKFINMHVEGMQKQDPYFPSLGNTTTLKDKFEKHMEALNFDASKRDKAREASLLASLYNVESPEKELENQTKKYYQYEKPMKKALMKVVLKPSFQLKKDQERDSRVIKTEGNQSEEEVRLKIRALTRNTDLRENLNHKRLKLRSSLHLRQSLLEDHSDRSAESLNKQSKAIETPVFMFDNEHQMGTSENGNSPQHKSLMRILSYGKDCQAFILENESQGSIEEKSGMRSNLKTEEDELKLVRSSTKSELYLKLADYIRGGSGKSSEKDMNKSLRFPSRKDPLTQTRLDTPFVMNNPRKIRLKCAKTSSLIAVGRSFN